MVNLTLSLRYVQQTFKIAVNKTLLKKPILNPDVVVNYRPILNLPFISKIIEKASTNQLCDHLDRNGLFEEFHSGFGVHHTTETTLVKVANDTLMASDSGSASIFVLLGHNAAFDITDHNMLLQGVGHEIGIKGTALRCFKSHLSDIYPC